MKRRWTKCKDCGKRNKWFHVSNAWKSGYNARCTECRARWRMSQPTYRADCQLYRKLASQRARLFVINYLKTHHCIDCSESRICTLSFDHIRGKKRANISKMITNGCSPDTIAKEIEKTVVRCLNCHAMKTARDRGYLRALIQFGR